MSIHIITLTTDFGTSDGYVGALKGVILSIAPHVVIVDISHNIPPQDVRRAAYTLLTAAPYFAAGTIHVAVVDPGVGSDRQAIALMTPQAVFIAPDNGLLTPFVPQQSQCVALTFQRQPASRTFHGRDIFAPAAAYLANGVPLAHLGALGVEPITLPDWQVQATRRADGAIEGRVVHIDRFGNLITNVKLGDEQQCREVLIAGRSAPLRQTYAQVAVGRLVSYVGSGGFVEIAIRDGSAAESLGVMIGAPVHLPGQGES